MALTTPYPLAFLSDVLKRVDVTFSLKRNDELSGSGDGRYWSAELARPLWQIAVTMSARWNAEARAVDAKIRALAGTRGSFLFSDPSYAPAGGVAPGSGVTVASIAADRTSITLSGLPAGYPLTAGDRLSVSASGRVWFAEISDSVVAKITGVTDALPVYPVAPLWLTTGMAVELANPFLKVFVPPDGHTPFTSHPGFYSDSAALSLLQRL